MRTALRVLLARLRRRALELEGYPGMAQRKFLLTPDGKILVPFAGAAPDDPPPDPESDPEPDSDPESDPDPDPEPDPADLPKFEGDFDEEKAKRAIAHLKERNRERAAKAKAEIDKANARAAELEREKETEQERVTREAGEAKAEADRQRANAERLTIDAAIRDAAAEADVPARTIKRLIRLIDRDAISVDADGEVDGAAEAVETFLAEFPEFKGKPAAEPGDGEPPAPEPPGGNPSRKQKPKDMTREQVEKMAKDDPEKFNELFDAGKIPASALAGVAKK